MPVYRLVQLVQPLGDLPAGAIVTLVGEPIPPIDPPPEPPVGGIFVAATVTATV